MLETLIVVLLILWLLGFFGPMAIVSLPHLGNGVHILIVVVLILVVLRLVRGGL